MTPEITKEIKFNRDTKDYDLYITIDGKRDYIGSASTYYDGEARCREYAMNYYTDNHTPEKAAQVVMAEKVRSDNRIILTSRRRAEYALNHQRIGGFAIDLAGDYWVAHDTPRMWRLMHRTTPNNDFVAVGSVADVLDAWEQREMHRMEACDCGLLNERGTVCSCQAGSLPAEVAAATYPAFQRFVAQVETLGLPAVVLDLGARLADDMAAAFA